MTDIPRADDLWRFDAAGSVSAAPTVVDDVVYVGDEDGVLYALDRETGEKRWSFETDGDITAAPTAFGDRLVVGNTDGHLYGLVIDSGTVEWTYEAGIKVTSAPTVVEGTVYAGTSGWDDTRVVALNAASGTEQWRFGTDQGVDTAPTVVRVSPGADGESVRTVFVGSGTFEGVLHALDAQTGTERWSFRPEAAINGSPTVDAVSRDGTTHPAFLDRTGEPPSGAAPSQQTVYTCGGTLTGSVYALDAATGDQRWEFETAEKFHDAPTVADSTVYAGGSDGHLFAVDAATGDMEWAVDASGGTGGGVTAPPTVAGDTVVVGTFAPLLVGVDAAAGDIQWTYSPDGQPAAPTVVDGTAIFGTDGGTVAAVSLPDSAAASRGSRVRLGTLGHHDRTVHRRLHPETDDTCVNCEADLSVVDDPAYCFRCGWELSA